MGEPEWRAVQAVIASGWVTQGPKVAEFEDKVAAFCGAEYAVAVSSCTSALHLSLVAAGIGAGDEVIVPSMSFIATANSVTHSGATPVFAEVDPTSFNLDLNDVATRVNPRTKAIMLVHQLGLPADIDSFAAFAAERDLVLIEDAACAIGSTYRGKQIGGHSEFVCFSFHPRKLITTGDGGMILTPSKKRAEHLRRLRHHGMSISDTVRHNSKRVIREAYPEIGYNARMTDIQAAVGVEQMRRLPAMLDRRRFLADLYNHAFQKHALIEIPVVPSHVNWNVQTYTIRLPGFESRDRDLVMQRLLDRGIATRAGVMTAHREPAYARSGLSLPVSEAASDTSLALPLYTTMTVEALEETIAAVIETIEAI